MPGLVKSRTARMALLAAGWILMGVAFVGIVLPGIPTTGPVLLAAFLFSKSSERFDAWLVSHRVFGPIVRDWRAGRGFTKRLKTTAVVAIAITFTITLTFVIKGALGRGLMIALALGIIAYILSLPTKPSEVAESYS